MTGGFIVPCQLQTWINYVLIATICCQFLSCQCHKSTSRSLLDSTAEGTSSPFTVPPGFVLIEQHINVSNGYFNDSVLESGRENVNDSTANTFCIIGAISWEQYLFEEGTNFYYWLRLIYRYEDGTNDTLEWTQQSWITESNITGTYFIQIPDDSIQSDRFRFHGLGASQPMDNEGSAGIGSSSTSRAYLDGNGGAEDTWYHAIATTEKMNILNNGIPAHNKKFAVSSSLYLAIPDSTVSTTSSPTILPTADSFEISTTNPSSVPTDTNTSNNTPTEKKSTTSSPTESVILEDTVFTTSPPLNTTVDEAKSSTSQSTSQWHNSYLTPIGIVMISIVVLAILLVVLGYGHMLLFGFDDFKLTAVVLFGIYSWDFFSDILFAADVWNNYLSQNASSSIPNQAYPQDATRVIIWSIFGASVVFVIFPLLKNFVDLLKFQGKWQQHPLHADRYMSWLDMYGNVLFFLSFLCGSTFAAVELVNSNLFGRRVFCMGLSKLDLREFNQKRLVNVVVGENLPQLLVQILYASAIEGEIGTVSGAAIISSSLSICAAVLDFVSKRKLMTVEVNQCLFSVKVTSTEKKFIENRSTFKHKTWYLSAEIARIFPVDRNAVEMLPMDKFSDHEHDGLIVHFLISTSRFTGKQMMDKLQENHLGHLARQIARAWELELEMMDLYDLVDTNYHLGDTASSVQIAMTRFNGRTDTKTTLQLFDDEDGPKETLDAVKEEGTDIVYDGDGQEGRQQYPTPSQSM